jgi:hypothetical protein
MKKISALILVFTCCSLLTAEPAAIAPKIQKGAWGFGLILGEPWAGWSLKYWLNNNMAIDAAIGVDYGLHLHGDILWHKNVFALEEGQMPLYYGCGIMMEMNSTAFGPRGVVGFDWLLSGAPIDIFLETAPTINFFNRSSHRFFWDFFFNFALGIRFYL